MKKRILSLLCAIVIIIATFCPIIAQAANSEDKVNWYTLSSDRSVEKIFNMSLGDITFPLLWLLDNNTYVVIKENVTTGELYPFLNTPNLQQLLENQVYSVVADGYTDTTYDVNDTEKLVKVGKNATSENVITKYGFDIPNYRYQGEYPKEIINVSAMVNKLGIFMNLWQPITIIFSGDFIEAPHGDDYKSLKYLNHSYDDGTQELLEFFKKYYIPYFQNKIAHDYVDVRHIDPDPKRSGEYFSGPEELVRMTITDEQKDQAETYNKQHQAEYDKASEGYHFYGIYRNSGSAVATCMSGETINGKDGWTYFSNLDKYKQHLNSYNNGHNTAVQVLANCAGQSGGSLEQKAAAINKNVIFNNGVNVIYSYEKQEKQSTVKDGSLDKASTHDWKTTEIVKNVTESYNDVLGSDHNFIANPFVITEPVQTFNFNLFGTKTEKWERHCGYNAKVYGGFDTNTTIDISEYQEAIKQVSFDSISYGETDFVTPELATVYKQYKKNVQTIEDWKKFNEWMERGAYVQEEKSFFNPIKALLDLIKIVSWDLNKPDELYYRQCLLNWSEDWDGKCQAKDYGNKPVSFSIMNVYANSGLYKITQNYSSGELSDQDAVRVIRKINTYCGPYADQVLGNMVNLMVASAEANGHPEVAEELQKNDIRIMPYDAENSIDEEEFDVLDPRVNIYKDTLIGSLLLSIGDNLNYDDFFEFVFGQDTIKLIAKSFLNPQNFIIGLCGLFTEISVFAQQICNFEFLDSIGLSPTEMWSSWLITLLMGFVALFFIGKTIKIIFSRQAKYKVLLAFLVLFIEVGLLGALAADPEGVWTTIKNIDDKIMNLGENTIIKNDKIEYLFGDSKDSEVNYYLPYFDIWSKYNTGYGLVEPQQQIDKERDAIELKEAELPHIGNNEIAHWSVLLADSFSYWGETKSAFGITVDNSTLTYNGVNINNNAYRVVDHFLAPRINLWLDGENNAHMETYQNENYNGEFQTKFSLTLLVKLLNCFLMMCLSIIKMLTFIYLWWMIYLFLFNIVLGKVDSSKSTVAVLADTFAPVLELFLIGLYNGIAMYMGMKAEGFLGIIVEIGLYFMTWKTIGWWHDLQGGRFFPSTLKWLYMITHIKDAKLNRERLKAQQEQDQIAREEGGDVFKGTEVENSSASKKIDFILNDSGLIKKQNEYDEDQKGAEDFKSDRHKYRTMDALFDAYEKEKKQSGKTNDELEQKIKDFKTKDSGYMEWKSEQEAKKAQKDKAQQETNEDIKKGKVKSKEVQQMVDPFEDTNFSRRSDDVKFNQFINEDGTINSEYGDKLHPKHYQPKEENTKDAMSGEKLNTSDNEDVEEIKNNDIKTDAKERQDREFEYAYSLEKGSLYRESKGFALNQETKDKMEALNNNKAYVKWKKDKEDALSGRKVEKAETTTSDNTEETTKTNDEE